MLEWKWVFVQIWKKFQFPVMGGHGNGTCTYDPKCSHLINLFIVHNIACVTWDYCLSYIYLDFKLDALHLCIYFQCLLIWFESALISFMDFKTIFCDAFALFPSCFECFYFCLFSTWFTFKMSLHMKTVFTVKLLLDSVFVGAFFTFPLEVTVISPVACCLVVL